MIAVNDYSPNDLLETARELMSEPAARAGSIWPRAAAHLCRQALEATLDDFWAARLPEMASTPRWSQLTCLPSYLNEAAVAEEVSYTWWALSRACHHRTYELAPTAEELNAWIETVHSLSAAVVKSLEPSRLPPN